MAKRIKPVKAWVITHPSFNEAAYTPVYHDLANATRVFKTWCAQFAKSGVAPKLVRVTVSVDDPRASRISAAERRVEATRKKALACILDGHGNCPVCQVDWFKGQPHGHEKGCCVGAYERALERAKGER